MEIVVIGSQAILATVPDAAGALSASVEADLYPAVNPEAATTIAGALGEMTLFHDTYGYYADGVGPETPVAPVGWQARLIPISNESTVSASGIQATGWCMEAHDLVLSKLAAGRDKDLIFARAAIADGRNLGPRRGKLAWRAQSALTTPGCCPPRCASSTCVTALISARWVNACG
ncbi:MAG: hypothetical protein ACYCUM_11155 [Solirubrobacteraceae bacterium]